MKIEMDGDSASAVIVVALCLTILALCWMFYRYNVSFLENGYTQVQLKESQMYMWVKGKE